MFGRCSTRCQFTLSHPNLEEKVDVDGETARNRGLHPVVDIFDDEEDPNLFDAAEACENGAVEVPGSPEAGECPLAEEEEEEEDDEENAARAPPLPAGPPPRLNPQQRARLHELLQQRDAEGRVPYNLDAYTTGSGQLTAVPPTLHTENIGAPGLRTKIGGTNLPKDENDDVESSGGTPGKK